MLNPLKVEIVVERSLSSWYKDVPLVDVRLFVHPVKVSLVKGEVALAAILF